jgi:3-hydroxybutyrate dehydrogenase
MKQNGWGRIINVASVHGLVGSVNKSAYCAAKHGLVGLTKVLALECAEQGITVNAICPGWVDTPLINDQISAIAKKQNIPFDDAKYQLVTAKQPLPEMMAPEQIGEFILFLCSDSARSITGSALPMDGAWTAQ